MKAPFSSRQLPNETERENSPPAVAIHASSSCKDFYSDHDRKLLSAAKAAALETTSSAQRALKVATETTQVAQATLEALYQQGQQLDRAAHGVGQIGEEAKHAGRILAFMGRCFCLRTERRDSDRGQDGRRRTVVQQQRMAGVLVAQASAEEYAAKRELVAAAVGQAQGGVPPTRASLIPAAPSGAAAAAAALQGGTAAGSMQGLHPDDQRELAQQAAQQDACLDQIDAAMGALKAMGLAMGQELDEQSSKVEALQRHAEDAGMALRGAAGAAAKLAGRAPQRQRPEHVGSWRADQDAAGAAMARAVQTSAPIARRYAGVR